MLLEDGERLEDLECNGLKIIQNKNFYTFTSDSVLLANFVETRASDVCVEIGTGCGVISILLSAKTKFKKMYAFEFQKEMALLAEKNVKLNGLESLIKVVEDDILNFERHISKGSADCVVSNPPYMLACGKNENSIRDKARHENSLPVDKLCMAASQLLKEGGKFFVVYAASRACELIFNLMKNRLEPKRMFFSSNGKGKVMLVVIEAVKGGKHEVKVLPELVTNDSDGKYLEQLHTKYVNKRGGYESL